MFFFLLLLLCFPVTAENRWFDRHSEGWFWYEPIQEQAPDKEALDKDTPEQPNGNTTMKPLSVPWIRQNIGHYLDKAIDEPSKENVSAYLYLDRLVKEKSERFARVGKQVIESDPMLDENVRRPISPAAAKIKDDMAYRAREAILRKIAKIAGLIFYYQGSCKLCHVQTRTVLLLSAEYGFKLIPISTDGLLIPGLPDNRIDRSPPPRLDIRAYPALFLMRPPDNIILLRQGGSSFTELTGRLVTVAYKQGWITEKEYLKTRITTETWNADSFPEKQRLILKGAINPTR